MTDEITTILNLCFLGLLYLFFLRVLQAVWSGSTTRVSVQQVQSRKVFKAAKKKQPTVRRGQPTRLAVLEPAEIAGGEYLLENELAIGRASSCHIVLDDSFISQLHARVMLTKDGVAVEDLGSTNGTYLNGEQLHESRLASIGDVIKVGNIVMELR